MGNHSCSNRGDAAIARGLMSFLHDFYPNADITLVSRFPAAATFVLGQHAKSDGIFALYLKPRPGLFGRFKSSLLSRLLPYALMLHVKFNWLQKLGMLPAEVQDEINFIRQFELVIHIGGSNLVDLYGHAQFDYGFCSLLAGKKPLLLGHSVGPFRSWSSRLFARQYFPRCQIVGLRENISQRLLADVVKDAVNITTVADTAWLLETGALPVHTENNVIAITVRTLKPFEGRLAMTDEEYLQKFAALCDKLTASGYRIRILSTCTDLDSYRNDDRKMAIDLQSRCLRPEQITVVMAELTDLQLGAEFSRCALTIATRLHSAIISMRFGTPAIVFNYEHKSKGVIELLGLERLALDFSSLKTEHAYQTVSQALKDREQLRNQIMQAVSRQRLQLQQTLSGILANKA